MKRNRLTIGANILTNYRFYLTPRFDRSVRRLKRRYPKINADLLKAFSEIEDRPEAGSVIPNDFLIRKLRVASSDMRHGKSGGYRLLYKLDSHSVDEVQIVMLFVYAKSDQSDVPPMFLETLSADMSDK